MTRRQKYTHIGSSSELAERLQDRGGEAEGVLWTDRKDTFMAMKPDEQTDLWYTDDYIADGRVMVGKYALTGSDETVIQFNPTGSDPASNQLEPVTITDDTFNLETDVYIVEQKTGLVPGILQYFRS